MENFELIEDTQVYEMPNGEFIRVWNDGDLYGDDSELKEDFEYYVKFMYSKYDIKLKP